MVRLIACPTCGGHFETLAHRAGKQQGVYVCATRRRKPGTCTNKLALPMLSTDEAILEMVEGEVLGTTFIEELLDLVDRGSEHQLHVEQIARLAVSLWDRYLASTLGADVDRAAAITSPVE